VGNGETHTGLAELIRRGGIYSGIAGKTPREVLAAFTGALTLPPSLNAGSLLQAVLEREALMSTSVGDGIALPHPRNPLTADPGEQFTAIAALDSPVDWRGLDGKAVDIVILIVSSSSKAHLHTLSAVNYFCRQQSFTSLLRRRAGKDEVVRFVEETERKWRGE